MGRGDRVRRRDALRGLGRDFLGGGGVIHFTRHLGMTLDQATEDLQRTVNLADPGGGWRVWWDDVWRRWRCEKESGEKLSVRGIDSAAHEWWSYELARRNNWPMAKPPSDVRGYRENC
jgi:hypothetical protein